MPQEPTELILMGQCASHLALPIWIADSDENLVYYNEPAEVLLGRRFEEAGELMLEKVPTYMKATTEEGSPLGLDAFPPAIALRERRPAHGRVRYQALDGVWRTVEVTAFPLEGQGGRHLGAVAIFWEAHSE